MGDNIIQKFRDKFFEEANMLLDKFEKDILELEKIPENKELHESVFRAMHTIKGISAMYGFEFISEFTHVLENIFQNMRDGKVKFSKEISEISLLSIDHIRNLLNDEKLSGAELRETHKSLLVRINTLSGLDIIEKVNQPETIKVSTEKIQSFYIIINTNEQMYFRGISLITICKELSALGEYKIQRIPVLSADNSDSWGIVIVSMNSLDDIREVLMFIEDDCCIFRIADSDIFNSEFSIEKKSNIATAPISNEPSILDLIEREEYTIADKVMPLLPEEHEIEKQTNLRQQSRRISVDTVKLDNLMYLVSQLITLNLQINESTRNRDYEKQRDHVEMLDTLAKQFRNNALEIRLVPLSDIALRFQRLIRDLSNTLGKKIEFVTEGIDTELDKNTIDSIVEPLMHIIRNCIDHGIEEPLLRKQAGKPETGTIKLSATYSGNYIVIRVQDDGNGIDLERVRKKAVEKGILKKSDKPTPQEIFDIIFLPGFSTAQSLSEVSGRGVGMDIVKKRITDLRGSVNVESKMGEGTSFIIKLNQSMAITDTLLFKVEDNYFIIPISEIEACDEIDSITIAERSYTSTIEYNNNLIPFVDLRKHLKLEGQHQDNTKSIIVRNGNNTIAVMADIIIGEHQAVLKPLHKTYESETIISSVSQLGNGKIAFLIDTVELHKQIAS